jgi:hypothetical protein
VDKARSLGARSLAALVPLAACALAIAASAGASACATSKVDSFDPSSPGPDGGSFSNEGGGPPVVSGEVYGHSEGTLYRVDTQTHAVAEVGVFSGCTYVADIALDEDSNIYASTGTDLFLVETNTARCTRIAKGTFPNSLSFVPAGTIDFGKETLVGYQGGDYVKIDPQSGAVTKLGELGGGYQSSGDVVSAKGGKTFVSVKGPDCADCLVEIDPKTGALTKNWGSLGHADVFGLAFWAGEVYAFTNAGEVLLVTFTADAISTSPIPIANAPADLKFWGAGSTTSAPLGPVH